MTVPPSERARILRAVWNGGAEWAEVVCGQTIWDIPRLIHERLKRPGIRLVVYGCHSCSKTHTGITSDFGFIRRHEGGRVIAIAPTGPQLTDIYWSEAHTIHSQMRYPIFPPLHRRGFEWPGNPARSIVGVSTDQPVRLRGKKGRPLRVHIEEVNGIREEHFPEIWSMFSQAGTQGYFTMNPTLAAGPAYEMVTGDSGLYEVIRITAWDTPNIKLWGPDRDSAMAAIMAADDRVGGPLDQRIVYPWLITPRFVRETFEKCGRDERSPVWKSRVEAEFPEFSNETLIRLDHLESAARPAVRAKGASRMVFSIDPAGRGNDECAFAAIEVSWPGGVEHRAIIEEKQFHDDDPRKPLAAHILSEYTTDEIVNSVTVVDVGGLGHHWASDLAELGIPNVGQMDYASSPGDKEAFGSLKAEVWTAAADLFAEGRVSGLDRGSMTFHQLTKVEREYRTRSLIIDIKPKEGDSPDRGEAVLQGLGWWVEPPATKRVNVEEMRRRGRAGAMKRGPREL